MKNKYIDLIEQSFEFPQDEFRVEDGALYFHDIPMMDVIEQYGTPLKISYLPKISSQIQRAKRMFNVAMAKVDYQGDYHYCYCTKSSHFSFVLEEALKNDIHIETSSAFDFNLIESLYDSKIVDKDLYIICNGYKKDSYITNIAQFINNGWHNTIPILDNMPELDQLDAAIKVPTRIGIRIAAEEEPKFEFYTSRLGIRYKDIMPFYQEHLSKNSKFSLKMLHFFINTGIKDNAYYWNELGKCVNVYCNLKAVCPTLDSLNIGGGLPIKNSLGMDYDYEYMIEEVVAQIKSICNSRGVEEPNIFTEFGSYTVGESGATIFSILGVKQQNDREKWYMVDSSFMTTLPDIWGIKQKFILLPINKWDKPYERVFLGGLTCDSQDYYNAEEHANAIFLPKVTEDDPEPLYIGFFHTGAYQESIAGYGGIQHCLQPAPKHIIIDKTPDGDYTTKLFSKEQTYKSMLKILHQAHPLPRTEKIPGGAGAFCRRRGENGRGGPDAEALPRGGGLPSLRRRGGGHGTDEPSVVSLPCPRRAAHPSGGDAGQCPGPLIALRPLPRTGLRPRPGERRHHPAPCRLVRHRHRLPLPRLRRPV